MMSSTRFFLESEGIALPDGTVFGGGIEPKFDITHGDNGGDYVDAFRIYQIVGDARIHVGNFRYKEMRAWVHDQVKHYESNGMKLWVTDTGDWNSARVKTLVTPDW